MLLDEGKMSGLLLGDRIKNHGNAKAILLRIFLTVDFRRELLVKKKKRKGKQKEKKKKTFSASDEARAVTYVRETYVK